MSTELVCPVHKISLDHDISEENYRCDDGCRYPIKNSIPRFVPTDNYASGFGLQWNEFRTTQLDSHTGVSISRNRLKRLLGGSIDIVSNKKVLEAGCGAGRFSEILLAEGAHLFAVDISTAVEANYQNCHTYSNYFVCQADILNLPFRSEQFDIVICIGVIQHTPDPEKTMKGLCEHVKPGGILIIDHYTYGYPVTLSRRLLRSLLLKIPDKSALAFCKLLTNILWPIHKILWYGHRVHKLPGFGLLRELFTRVSPLVDYHDSYPELGPRLLKTWALLDTHDTLTDYYKHLRSAEEINEQLKNCGMQEIETHYEGNGVEMRYRKKR